MSLQALSVTQTSRLTRSGRSNCRQAADLIVAAQSPSAMRTRREHDDLLDTRIVPHGMRYECRACRAQIVILSEATDDPR